MQETLVAVTILAAVGYGCRRVYEAFRLFRMPVKSTETS